jgi:DNA-binding transcriptional regulator YhcF (GntR family)
MSEHAALRIVIDSASTAPPYEQIRSQLAAGISGGSIVAGTRLPTVRSLADELGVAVNTVARSYRELEAAGLVETAGRAGTVVTAAGDAARSRVVAAAMSYATLAAAVGIDRDEAARIVRNALDQGG